MSTPIKPPGDPSAPDAAVGADAPEGADGAFEAVVDEARAAGRTDATPEATSGVLDDLSAGRLTPDEAIERLVERALSSARGLPESQRDALAAQLREALEADPTLLALREDLRRATSKA